MAKTITINYEGTEYTLEYTRRSIQEMEKNGFVAQDVEKRPMTVIPELFAGAFLAHHRFVKKDVIDKIFSRLKDKVKLVETLSEMYAEPFETLLEDPDESEGNLDWGVSR